MSSKRAVIMGATSGMGKGVAIGLLKEGYTIGVAGRRGEELDIKFTDIRPGFVATDFIAGDSYPMQMQTDYVVKHILKAVKKGQRKVTIDWRYRILCFFWRLLPACVWERMAIKN